MKDADAELTLPIEALYPVARLGDVDELLEEDDGLVSPRHQEGENPPIVRDVSGFLPIEST
jgi:hypothetical protein